MKQTAIEWLIEQCPRIETIVAYNILEQAKQIEKKQINKAYYQGIYDKNEGLIKEEYYKEIFNK